MHNASAAVLWARVEEQGAVPDMETQKDPVHSFSHEQDLMDFSRIQFVNTLRKRCKDRSKEEVRLSVSAYYLLPPTNHPSLSSIASSIASSTGNSSNGPVVVT